MSVEVYYTKMKGLWDEFITLETGSHCTCECTCECICGEGRNHESQEQRRKLMQFLRGLNDSFPSTRGQILRMNPLPTVSQAYSMIKQEEKQTQGYTTTYPDATALVAQLSNIAHKFHGKKNNLMCSYYNGTNHFLDTCFLLHGYPPDHPKSPANKGKKKTYSPGYHTSYPPSFKPRGPVPARAMNKHNPGSIYPYENVAHNFGHGFGNFEGNIDDSRKLLPPFYVPVENHTNEASYSSQSVSSIDNHKLDQL